MNKENQRITLTRRLLQESILRLLSEKDLDSITVTELCRDAGINRATFYRHYAIPKDVLMEAQMDLYLRLKQQIPAPKNAADMKATIDQLCSFMERNSALLKIIIRNNSDTDIVNFFMEIYQDLWQELELQKYLPGIDMEDFQLISIYSAGGSYFLLRQWMLGNTRKTGGEMAAYLYQLIEKTGSLLSSDLAKIYLHR